MTYAEGEYVDGRFMLFDIFFLNNKDVRKETLVNRIKILDELIKIINKDSYKFRTYSADKFELKSVIDFYKKDLIDYVKYLNENKKLIDRKYFLFPIGFDVREIFAYSVLIWEELRKGPYMLDGLIYTGMQQIYTTIQKDIAFPILKWKPEDLNSIDMYIEFVKNDRGEIENVYDNSNNIKERLFIDVWTNGSISPEQAIFSGSNLIIDLFKSIGEHKIKKEKEGIKEKNQIKPIDPYTHIAIEELQLSVRPYNCLKRAQINTIGDLLEYSPEKLLELKNFGRKSADEVFATLKNKLGIVLK
jgi:hypothetical protein